MKWIARRARYRYVIVIMKKQRMPAMSASRPPPILSHITVALLYAPHPHVTRPVVSC